MFTLRRVVVPLRALLALLFLGLLVGQTLSFPGMFAHQARENPLAAGWQWPLTLAAVFGFLCAEVVVVCTWRLLGLVRDGRIFSARAFVWVDVIVGAMVTAWLVLAAIGGSLSWFIYVTPQLRDPGVPMMLFGMTVVGAVLVLTMVVMRALLRQATVLRTELDAVI
ncbi:membrane protein [Tersicoccus solisilvae]|uniref:Membrane protein n=1 Tax=Tersicoccus solisilvae TaxID=1882339 RepID=A0ABQ1PKA8_9MICC|nr:DUF2975 domain-containing protein [Tersicoccus solisilvae]GGC98708.1 membrane protein [Tersicoccus solisilvae]